MLNRETLMQLTSVSTQIIGSVWELCLAAEQAAHELGYEPIILTDHLDCQAKEARRFLGSIARTHANDGKRLAFIARGETVVRVVGNGLGGRNQELTLSASEGISGIANACVLSIGSYGTDGPTDAAGGYVDGDTVRELAANKLTVSLSSCMQLRISRAQDRKRPDLHRPHRNECK